MNDVKIKRIGFWFVPGRTGLLMLFGLGFHWKAPGERLYYSQRNGSNGVRVGGWWFGFTACGPKGWR